ncbi:DNA-directed RNA polymerase beta subunit [Gregarina niphandrodes]|uniref:DNA-directed RNA polymerase subunit beta n=1 Tax=Gregarina niphandrodes TaxID=110365 RepID=A0A023B475_GRENI|nr:DNA-directed RNA polymerase beta subunit [Gregarina niphandrodes]EZG56044.1 DNA-directed RNA polymerase beta subunit [Gregarina niphandrodes]|eukprot:XP_011131363.1 DNA-directed RNA polymerase beta subunit [Gregarina niphandrodes]
MEGFKAEDEVEVEGEFFNEGSSQEEDDEGMDGGSEVDEEDVEGEEITPADSWEPISAFFRAHGLVFQQVESFNYCVAYSLQEVITNHPPIAITLPATQSDTEGADFQIQYRFKFTQLTLSRPTVEEASNEGRPIWPQEARLRNLTYSAQLYVDVMQETFKVYSNGTEVKADFQKYPQVPLGRIPIMLRSAYCWLHNLSEMRRVEMGECGFDQGGYFIVNGMEKVLIAQEKMASNFVYVFKKSNNKVSWVAEIRCQREDMQATSPFAIKIRCRSTGIKSKAGGQIVCVLPYIRSEIPLVVLFRALGILSDNDICQRIVRDPNDYEMLTLLKPSLEEGSLFLTQSVCLDYIGRRGPTVGAPKELRVQYARELLHREVLSHVGHTPGCENRKAWFLGNMTHRLLQGELGRAQEDDRDHFGKKRIDLAGALISSSFGQLFRKMVKDATRTLQRQIEGGRNFDLAGAIRMTSPITQGLNYQLATGNWGKNKEGAVVRTGVSQVLNRLTFLSALSHLRRLNTPLGREGKMAKPRQLHNTHWGMICPAETPEGQSVGLVKNLALMCRISVGFNSTQLKNFLWDCGMQALDDMTPAEMQSQVRVFVNGAWLGCFPVNSEIVLFLKQLRREGKISNEASIVFDAANREIRIFSDAGRSLRPLYLVKKNKLVIRKHHIQSIAESQSPDDWSYLVKQGTVEFLDCEEEEAAMVAMFVEDLDEKRAPSTSTQVGYCKTYTHCEIHPSMLLGVCATLIPFPDHNQSPRNVYQSAMGKQAMGIYISNFNLRYDSTAHVLFYPQKPLVCTRGMAYLRFRELPAGINCVVAIMTYTGYNQEDSLIMSQSSIDRGLFRSMFFRTYVAEERQRGSLRIEQFEKPDPATAFGLKRGDYSKLDIDGLAEPGSFVLGDDIIIGKTMPVSVEESMASSGPNKKTKRDASHILRTSENGVVESVMLSVNGKGFRFVKVKVRSVRVPQIGDKFASRHGQKGTIGVTYRQEDLPFNRDGTTPDIIMNPHAIPSRMTIGHIVECLLGKYYAIVGGEGDATPFMGLQVMDITEKLNSVGHQRFGNERLYSGFTGLPLENLIFFGPTYYQRLKHMVDDKIHSRARGPITTLTRQPMEGRSREGGLRFGEMERDCMIAHGAAKMLKERLFDQSDAYRVHVCDLCGLFATADLTQGHFSCPGCQNETQISQVCIPYACKLLLQELMAMQVYPKLCLTVA